FCLVRTEFSTWVNLSLYVIAVLRSENIGFKYMTMNQVSSTIISKETIISAQKNVVIRIYRQEKKN
ncbi:hypothetical protein ACI3PF_20220, partial [Lactococcus lactis]